MKSFQDVTRRMMEEQDVEIFEDFEEEVKVEDVGVEARGT